MKVSQFSKLPLCSVFFSLLAISFTSCEKTTESNDDLVGNWSRLYEFEGVGRTEAVTFTINNIVYVGSGFDGSNRLNDFWSFDKSTGTWTSIKPFPGDARNSAVAFAINGKGYVGTGIDENATKLKDFWEYDPIANNWTQVADFGGTARYGAVAFSIGGKGYVCSGYDGNYLKDLWEYDPTTNSWVQKSSLYGSKRSGATAFVYNDKGYVLTGFNNGSYLNDFWAYDPTTDSWTEKRKISDATEDDFDDDYGENIRRSNAVIFVMNGYAYLTCGSKSGVITTTWQYDISNDLWKEKTNFEGSAREGALGFSIENRGFIVTGNNSSYRFDDMWEFFPNDEQNDYDN
ncbi:MAG TPA: kelch repeat-containing protein [Chitinophagaceae bacterium]|nr:kelch repeat-containing protein [Chitinophagaceae bacterium]